MKLSHMCLIWIAMTIGIICRCRWAIIIGAVAALIAFA